MRRERYNMGSRRQRCIAIGIRSDETELRGFGMRFNLFTRVHYNGMVFSITQVFASRLRLRGLRPSGHPITRLHYYRHTSFLAIWFWEYFFLVSLGLVCKHAGQCMYNGTAGNVLVGYATIIRARLSTWSPTVTYAVSTYHHEPTWSFRLSGRFNPAHQASELVRRLAG